MISPKNSRAPSVVKVERERQHQEPYVVSVPVLVYAAVRGRTTTPWAVTRPSVVSVRASVTTLCPVRVVNPAVVKVPVSASTTEPNLVRPQAS